MTPATGRIKTVVQDDAASAFLISIVPARVGLFFCALLGAPSKASGLIGELRQSLPALVYAEAYYSAVFWIWYLPCRQSSGGQFVFSTIFEEIVHQSLIIELSQLQLIINVVLLKKKAN